MEHQGGAGTAPYPEDPDSKPLQLKQEPNWPGLKRGKGRAFQAEEQHEQWPGGNRTQPFWKTESVVRRAEALVVCGKAVGEGPERRREARLRGGMSPSAGMEGKPPRESGHTAYEMH